jgi:hypothetical protein
MILVAFVVVRALKIAVMPVLPALSFEKGKIFGDGRQEGWGATVAPPVSGSWNFGRQGIYQNIILLLSLKVIIGDIQRNLLTCRLL